MPRHREQVERRLTDLLTAGRRVREDLKRNAYPVIEHARMDTALAELVRAGLAVRKVLRQEIRATRDKLDLEPLLFDLPESRKPEQRDGWG